MKTTETIVDTCLLTAGTIYSLENIEHILGIAILVVNLMWIILKLVVKISHTYNNGCDDNSLDENFEETLDVLNDVKDVISSVKGDSNERDTE